MKAMKINLEYPYNEIWDKGYIVTNPENRKTLILYNSKNDRSSTQYARYLLAVKLGRFLKEDETVDHLDGDKTNNSIDNLQVLSLADNNRKSFKKPDVIMKCPICGKTFTRTRSQLRGRLKKALANEVCCSRACVYAKLRHS